VVSLVVGDFVFAAGEVGLVTLSWSLLDVPFLMVPALMGVALLHPSSRLLDETLPAQRRVMSRSRRFTVCVAILAPVIVLLVDDVSEPRLVSALLCVLLAGTAALRIGLAMQGEVAALRRLSHQATHDDLTGLPTRQLLTERADRMLRSRTGSLAVIFIDLDRFKLVNDSVGHSAGDGLLVAVAERLLASAPPDAMVSRVSGDEFLVLVGADAAEALEVAERLRAALCEPFTFGSGADVFSSASVGVAVSNPSIPTDGVTLMREADAAMYRSKENGRNMVTMFDATMRERVERRVQVEQDLRTAVDAGTISVNYQVVVSWPESRVVGLEALARWTRENGEQIAPAEFIDIAEESGLIVPLGDFVLEEALRQVAWLRANVPGASDLQVAVNVSPRQFRTGDLADVVEELLLKYGLPGDALCLEITEGVLMVDSIAAAATMAAIASLGVRLAVDDFGTGFSSLSYLQRFPIDVVKIDRSFVRDVATDDGARTLVAAIVGMARALRLGVVAEGVETEEQARRLRNIGCETMQGFWWGAAVPIVDVPRLIVSIAQRGERARRARCASVRN